MNALSTTRPPGYAALRKGRVSVPGQIYLVTFTTFKRAPLFAEYELAALACRAFVDPRLWIHSRLLAWVLMPDHWHGLLSLGKQDALSRRVQLLKSNSARWVRGERAAVEKVWEKGFHDHALRADQDLLRVARYLVANPIRAGLVGSVGDYPYWDAVWI